MPSGRLFQIFADRFQENVPVNRLAQIIRASAGHAFLAIFRHGVGRQGDDRDRHAAAAQFHGRGVAVHHGHLHIHQNQIERLFAMARSTAICPFSAMTTSAAACALHAQQTLVIGPVLDQKDRP